MTYLRRLQLQKGVVDLVLCGFLCVCGCGVDCFVVNNRVDSASASEASRRNNHEAIHVKDHGERAKVILEHAEKLDCKRYLTEKDIMFKDRNGLSGSADSQKMSFAEMIEKHLGKE
ncbi:hypothetical protein RJ641_032853 [Dillenia turbinata]|uniref:Uncharacterized protein n=1 Tax=Dillenia turbinata TaxID=194707 RepID=A0AAN8ZJ10_9MAGN